MGEAGDKAEADRIGNVHHHDRDGLGRLSHCLNRRRPQADNDFRAEAHQFGGKIGKPLQMAVRPTDLDFDVVVEITERA